tara:strand:+ start:1399 stop:2922 length:1524 start_codon:yes stop_codon:yes gene_type:complete
MNISTLLTKAAVSHGRLTALATGTTASCNYSELERRVGTIARNLRERYDLVTGDRVAVVMANRSEYLEIKYAIWHAGLVAVPINAGLHAREFQYILSHSGARLCIADSEHSPTVTSLVSDTDTLNAVICTETKEYSDLTEGQYQKVTEVAHDDAAWLFYTSGTTGRPKGATLTHRGLLTMTLSYYADIEHLEPGAAVIHAAPLSHGSGLYGLPFVGKAGVSVFPESRKFDPDEMYELIAAWPRASFFAVPTMITRLTNCTKADSWDTSNLSTIVYGGAPMYVSDLQKALSVFGPKFVQIYGQGETPMTATFLSKLHHADDKHPRYLDRLRSAGICRTDTEVQIVDENGDVQPLGKVGEITVRGDVVMKGYWNNPDATNNSLRKGWLYTGDLGSLDEDGFLTISDRSKDLIISGGSNVYPREIEEVLMRHHGVLECSIIGRPHSEWGEEVVAFVVLRPGIDVVESELDQLCLDNVARFKRPRAYFFIDRLPKSNYGKILKTALRDQLN